MKITTAFLLCALFLCSKPVAAQWPASGLPICTDTKSQTAPQIITDGSGGAIIMWHDARDAWQGLGHEKMFAQRVDAQGMLLWDPDGVPVGDTSRVIFNAAMFPDGAAGAIVLWTWASTYKQEDIFAQRISSNGTALWTWNGIQGVPVCTAANSQLLKGCISDGNQGAIITWEDSRTNTQQTYAQHIDASGSRLWGTNGIPISAASWHERTQTITPDGAGGAIIAWQDLRSGSAVNWDVYAQRVTSSGTLLWPENGTLVCAEPGNQGFPMLMPDGEHGAFVVWRDYRNGNYDLFAQRIDANGNRLWTPSGVSVCSASGEQGYEHLFPDGSGGIIVLWWDGRGATGDYFAQRITAEGNPLWETDGRLLDIPSSILSDPTGTSDGAGGMIITWLDGRHGTREVYADRIGSDGSPLWTPGGIPVCLSSSTQLGPVITSDLAGGAIVAWADGRGGPSDIYAQHLNSAEGIIATLLQSFSASYSGFAVRVTWTLSEMDPGAEFIILRAEGPAGEFIEIPGAAVARNGLSFVFEDDSVQPGSAYRYRVEVLVGSERSTLIETEPIVTPAAPLTLYQNQPNPFNPSTSIRFYLPERGRASIEVYGATGKRIATLAEGVMEKGIHSVGWNGRDAKGHPVASGVYFYLLRSGKETATKKMVLMR